MIKFLFVFILVLAACESEEDRFTVCDAGETANNGCGQCSCVDGRWDCEQQHCADLNFKAGFVEVEPISFTLRRGADSASY